MCAISVHRWRCRVPVARRARRLTSRRSSSCVFEFVSDATPRRLLLPSFAARMARGTGSGSPRAASPHEASASRDPGPASPGAGRPGVRDGTTGRGENKTRPAIWISFVALPPCDSTSSTVSRLETEAETTALYVTDHELPYRAAFSVQRQRTLYEYAQQKESPRITQNHEYSMYLYSFARVPPS